MDELINSRVTFVAPPTYCGECGASDHEHIMPCSFGHEYWRERAEKLEQVLLENSVEVPPR